MSQSRRRFFGLGLASTAAALAAAPAAPVVDGATEEVSLNGEWQFRLDAESAWRTVRVPHTWQVEAAHTEYYGVAWYRRTFDAPKEWADRYVRVEFEAVFHTAVVTLNGKELGRHVGKGYTAFTIDLSPHLKLGAANVLEVRVDNAFNESMLPRGKSSDWAHDGGIYRPVQLLITPKVFIERLAVDAEPDLKAGSAAVGVTAIVRNLSAAAWNGRLTAQVAGEGATEAQASVAKGERKAIKLPPLKIAKARLWHFDHPNLYDLTVRLSNRHASLTTFGVRKIETRDCAFFLNGERIRPMGVERMAGSHPEYGMAEPAEWIEHDKRDMKELNCIYTRVHWQQDKRLLDWCDRNGMMIQTEVPTWGPRTFAGMKDVPSDDIMNNGLEQLREMIERDGNHPCIFSWGVCNEIGGQNAPAHAFAKRMYEEAKRLDPKRLVTYASNSLQKTPEKDVSGLMDYVMWNEYYESWYKGTPADLARNLDQIHGAFPNKAIVISEYGYCACTVDRPENDPKRIDVLREHDAVFRARDYVAGLIFFDYNDYRTHIGDRGTGAMKQRVHGVVDLYGARKPSWEQLRRESSPVESLGVEGNAQSLAVTVKTRAAVPSYTLRGYTLRAIAYGAGGIPVELLTAAVRDLAPGETARATFQFKEKVVTSIRVDLLRPTGESTAHRNWGR